MANSLIYLQEAVDAIESILDEPEYQHTGEDWTVGLNLAESALYNLPFIEIVHDKDFERQLHDMFDHIWDCEIDHPIFQDTVGDLMTAVIQSYNNIFDNNYCVPLHTDDMRGKQDDTD